MNEVLPVDRLDLRITDKPWVFAEAERRAITAHWDRITAERPFLWNGDVLICGGVRIADGLLSASFSRTDYASFVAWRDWGWPDREAYNCFGVPAVVSSDGFLLMGTMGHRTLNSGMAYPPSGSLEARDIGPDGIIDVDGSMVKEVREETGLDLGPARTGRRIAVIDGQRLAIARRFDMPMPFADFEAAFRRHAAIDSEQELAGIFGLRRGDEIKDNVPAYACEIIRDLL